MKFATIKNGKNTPKLSNAPRDGLFFRLNHAATRWRDEFRRRRVQQPPWIIADSFIRKAFCDDRISIIDRFNLIFRYLVSGACHYLDQYGSRIYYPGPSSYYGAAVDGTQAMCRLLPMFSSWLESGRTNVITTLNNRKLFLDNFLAKSIINGTNPDNPGFWGYPRDYDQRIVEAADVALTVWMLRHSLWLQFSPQQQNNICIWLERACRQKVYDNNWLLFPVVIDTVLRTLGHYANDETVRQHYRRFKSFYAGDGWFSDGIGDIFDYYNAWAIHYTLFWLNKIDPELDPNFIQQCLVEFVRTYRFLISPQGIVPFGRSLCYRLGTPAPLIAAGILEPPTIAPGMAQRAFDVVWKHFIERHALCQGTVTLGYWNEDLNLMENYIGPGSCLWSLRSLVLGFHAPELAPFWTAKPEPLPIEKQDFEIQIPSIGWTIIGCQRTLEIIINRSRTSTADISVMNRPSLLARIVGWIGCCPVRPDNRHAKYELTQYNSRRPFWMLDSR